MEKENGISIIDFKPFLDGTDKLQVSQEIMDSFKRVGFVYLVNHGIDEDKIQTMFSWSKRFFELSMEMKLLAPHPASGTHHRGYSAPGKEKIIQDFEGSTQDRRADPPDNKESFEVGREDDDLLPNIWLPDDILPGFKEGALDFFMACRTCQLDILKALSIGFGFPEDYFLQFHQKMDNQLRLLHYPSVDTSLLEKEEVVNRITAHSDFDTFTLLFQDNIGGLEVEDPSNPGAFLPVPPIPGSVVVNVGDFLMRWSNDTFRSTIHRVRAPPGQIYQHGIVPERFSIPCFCSVDLDTVIDCLPGTYHSSEKRKKYEPISAREYVNRRLAANY